MRRLNVRRAQIEEYKQKRLFAINFKPQKPPLEKGELLLLQLVKTEALKSNKQRGRIEFALKFDHFEEDHDGSLSRKHWPSERRRWKWILHCSSIKHIKPFSLEELNLSRSYGGQDNARYIDAEDEKMILQHISKNGQP
jgi:hypothetical protein